MATVKIDTFHGIAPRQHPTQLADGMAVTAHNCRLKNGKLVPLRNPGIVDGVTTIIEPGMTRIAEAGSIHAWKKTDGNIEFLLFKGDTWMSDGNIADDSRTRVIVSGDTGESFADSGQVTGTQKTWTNTPLIFMRNANGMKFSIPLAKNPLPALHVRLATGVSAPGENKRYTRIFATWVDQYGYESPVSAPSLVQGEGTQWVDGDLEYTDGDKITVEAIGTANVPAEAEIIRFYKVVTGTEEGRIQFVSEIDASTIGRGAETYTFAVKDENAGEVIQEIECPIPDMRCILDVPGAFYCGFSRSFPKTVCFSDVDLIYSWPIAYRYDVKDNIVALAVTSNTVFALTDGWPYVLSGTDPSGMTVTKLAGPAACVSSRGVCVFRNAVYYVGHQGLMTIYNDANAGTVCSNLTDKIFTKDQWQALNPSSCVMGQHDGSLHLFFTAKSGMTYEDGTRHKGISIDLTENANAVTTHDEAATCLCVDNKSDKMYYVREGV